MKNISKIRVRILLRQCRYGLLLMFAWFSFGVVGFYHWHHLSLKESLLDALYLNTPDRTFWDLYSFWGQCLVFGIIVTIFILQAFERYNPLEGCRMLAREMKHHTIIIGYTHLGARIVDQYRQEGRPYVLIEKDSTAVDHLVRLGEPVIVDNAKETSTLQDAGVGHAEKIIIASNNIETSLIVTKKAREMNKSARLIVRCYLDEFTEILEGLGADDVISSSKSAFRELSGLISHELPTERG